MTNEEYKELSECLIFLQLALLDREGKLTVEGFATLTNMRFDGWDGHRTDEIIKKFIRRDCD